jgi:putative hydrolase of the HAD superfamily
MVKAILFDIDDTLFPSSEFAELARRNAIRAMIEMGIGRSESELYGKLMRIISSKGSNFSNHFDVLCKELRIRRPARYVAAAVGAYANTKTAIQPYPTVPRTLLALRESGYRLYVATNGEAIKQWDKLIRLQIALFFEDVFVSEELGEEKGPSFFRKALKSLNSGSRALKIGPKDCVMVGDREDADIAPAKAFGMLTIRSKTGKHAGTPSKADFTIREFGEIERIVESLKRGQG